ncbi:uncharacterized protein ARMOST_10402 [Armillaria ostoyae]|uniref:Uncharacterized protein n=1 Tax=Armillaria ostoyae TaxID=47428 RepID=A0A284RE71_ARMOS|nr:uncharacterized protein ARMOST_10402 [Armillaria ostoyae]
MDTETLTGVHNTTDVLLALTGHFLQYCVVQTSQNIQADYNQVSTPVLCKSSSSDIGTNGPSSTSLVLSFITARIAALVNQSLHNYVAIVSKNSPIVPESATCLPLHRYSALFFSGLAIFLFLLGIKVAWLVSITRVMAYAAYFFAPIIPLIHPYFLHQSPSYHGFIRINILFSDTSLSNMLVRFPAMRDWWYKAVVRPLQWNRSEEFFAWAFLERVEVAVMIGELLAESDLLRVTTEQQTYLAKASNDTPVERGVQNFGDPSCLLPSVKDGTDFTASNCGHPSAIDVTLIEEGVNLCKEPCKPCPIIN